MSTEILDLLRQRERMSVTDFAGALRVTATAVRQQLQKLLAEELVDRTTLRGGRGRPHHEYRLTEKGRRTSGNNFTDLALALWMELKEIPSLEIRRGLLQRLATRMSAFYRTQVPGGDSQQRMQQMTAFFEDRNIPLQIRQEGTLPVIDALACPYPELAQQDRSICSLERMMFSDLVGEPLRLSQCRLDGDSCCTFTPTRNTFSETISIDPLAAANCSD